ncbi:MAG: hypothetical protein ACRQFF_02400 [Sphaerochaeta sp.]
MNQKIKCEELNLRRNQDSNRRVFQKAREDMLLLQAQMPFLS